MILFKYILYISALSIVMYWFIRFNDIYLYALPAMILFVIGFAYMGREVYIDFFENKM